MNLPQLKIKQDVQTRRNSTLTMLERLILIKSSLAVTLAELPKAPESLDAAEWEIISDTIPLLKPIEDMTVELSGEKYPSISILVPLVRGLQLSLRNYEPKTAAGMELQTSLVEVISRRLSNLEKNRIIACATFLDPRMKKLAFGYDENPANAQKWVLEELTQILAAKNTSTGTATSTSPDIASGSSTKKTPDLEPTPRTSL